MSERGVTESVVEQAGLAWLESLGWTVKDGPDITPGELAAEPGDHTQSVIQNLQRDTLLPKLISGEIRIKDVGRIAGGMA